MGDKSTQLFDEFAGTDAATWLKKIEKDLKGKPLDILKFNPEFDLEAKAWYHLDEVTGQSVNQAGVTQNNNDWFITETIRDEDSEVTNTTILNKLNNGTTGLRIILQPQSDFNILFKDVLLEHIFVHLVFDSIEQFEVFSSYLNGKQLGLANFELPVLTQGLASGRLEFDRGDLLKMKQIAPEIGEKGIVVSGTEFGNYGASTTQELAIVVSQLNEILQTLKDGAVNLEYVAENVAVNLSINNDYFVNIAKFRAVKVLVDQLFQQWGVSYKNGVWINAETGIRNLTENDRYNNLLRQTTEVMSAVSGGVNAVTVKPYSDITGDENELAERMSRNIQLILKEEAYFDKVIDPGAGAYYIEYLTDQLVQKAWQMTLQIEDKGGYIEAVKIGFIQALLNEHKSQLKSELNNGNNILLGVNKFPNSMEDWRSSASESNIQTDQAFEPFSLFRLESQFEKFIL